MKRLSARQACAIPSLAAQRSFLPERTAYQQRIKAQTLPIGFQRLFLPAQLFGNPARIECNFSAKSEGNIISMNHADNFFM